MNKPFKVDDGTRTAQLKASDPQASAWVSANAGSGKTHVLTQRVIRLLLAGCAPDRILCLTYTKAAAAEMKSRVFSTLGKWSTMPDEELDAAMAELSGEPPKPLARTLARQLFARALDTPGGLKIQTIHAFCESLLHQFPLEANVPGHFRTIEGSEQQALIAHARSEVLSAAFASSKEIARHYAELIELASDAAIEAGLDGIISLRHRFGDWLREDPQKALAPVYRNNGIADGDTESSLTGQIIETLPFERDQITDMQAALAKGTGSSDSDSAEALAIWLSEEPVQAKFLSLKTAFLTREGQLKKRLCTKSSETVYPGITENLIGIAEHIMAGLDQIAALRVINASKHLFAIAVAVLERYEHLKRQRGAIDHDDQIRKTEILLGRSHIRDWIRYRLDRGIDHVLVDEAQDTSPAQWSIIRAITEDFHSGETAANTHRTLFVVGDDKQSIFSFQGADPREFALQWRELEKRVRQVDRKFNNSLLKLSFRSTADVLHAVDKVFSLPENAIGLTQSGEVPPHDSARTKAVGEVEIWPLFEPQETAEPEDWLQPIDHTDASDPANLLAERVAETVKAWVGKPLPGSDEPLRHKDVLVLVRDRHRFVSALTRQMKKRGIAIAGADRLKLVDHIAVEDLLALGRVCQLPQDDLSLAAVLKSPLFGVDEEELFALCDRAGQESLWDAIFRKAQDDKEQCHDAALSIANRLTDLRNLAQSLDVYGFYARVLGAFGGRKAMIARLGGEAEDVLDAFLEEALTFTQDNVAGLEAFIEWLSQANPEVKRQLDMEQDELRIMTVHSAKGLEAKVVFLIDSGKAVWTEHFRPAVLEIETEEQPGLVWMPKGTTHTRMTRTAVERIVENQEAEYRRLLYVGLTRAADRLIVCGYRGRKSAGSRTWHQMVADALIPEAREALDEAGDLKAHVWSTDPDRNLEADHEHKPPAETEPETALPDWITSPVASEPPPLPPLSPSATHSHIEKSVERHRAVGPSTVVADRGAAIKRGRIIHALLQNLPELDPAHWEDAIYVYFANSARGFDEPELAAMRSEVLAILQDPEFGAVFREGSRAEVSVTGSLETKSGVRPIAGSIDRLFAGDEEILIVDYKTDRMPPVSLDEIPVSYLRQLGLYRHLIKAIYPGRAVSCAILWTSTPRLAKLPEALVDAALEDLAG